MKEAIIRKKTEKQYMRPTRQIALSFLIVIFTGAVLLSLPISNIGPHKSFIDHLFTATSATCVTGLVTVVPVDQYTMFGQIVILLLIQIGGLGFLTFLYLLLSKIRKKLSMTNKMVLQEALNRDSLTDLPKIAKDIIKYTFIVEAIGALLLMSVFVPEFGLKGIYYGIFHSISAFCNAGFDVLGSTSLIAYQSNLIITIVIPGLIILGGLGFIVWFDIRDTYKKLRKRPVRLNFRLFFSKLSVHSKLVLIFTFLLLLSGTILFYICEFTNDKTIGNLSLFDQLQVSFFQSATLRTAGFATTDMAVLNTATKFFMCIFMVIGGSPLGTAGGIKTIAFAITIMMIYNIYQGGKELHIFGRRIKKRLIVRSFAISAIALIIIFISVFLLSITEQASFIDIVFEVSSAIATVGLTAAITPTLSMIGKIIIIILMYIGRIGAITLVISFARKSHKRNQINEVGYPDEDVLLG